MASMSLREIDQMFKFIEENIDEVKKAFASYDHQCTGHISVKNLGVVIRNLGFNPTEDELDDIKNTWDVDQSGVVSFIDFLQIINRIWNGVDEIIREAFKIFDSDGSGTIDIHEFTTMMNTYAEDCIKESDISDMVIKLDSDGDGQIGLEEFIKMLTADDV